MIYTGFAVMILQCGYNRWLHGAYKSIAYLHCCYACYNWLVDSFVFVKFQ